MKAQLLKNSSVTCALVVLTMFAGCSEPESDVIVDTESQSVVPTAIEQDAITPRKAPSKDIYDENADARLLIANAVKQADKEGKNVLITWGGNWCGWCHKLHAVFEDNTEINQVLNENFVRIAIDNRNNKPLMKEMAVNPNGVPYLTVLNSSGKKLMDQATGPLEIGSVHDPKKVMAFLRKALPKV